MNTESLKNKITELIPNAVLEESGDYLNLHISAEELLPVMQLLRNTKELFFNYLFCMTCVDWKDHFMMVYHLESKIYQHTIVVKAKINDVNNPKIESVNSLWKTAALNEDEIYDFFGITFMNHPNLRRLFLTDDWEGYPLRKNYSDINMIKL